METIFQRAGACGLIDAKPEATLDATGLESHAVSRHFLARSGRMKQFRRWPKLTLVCHNASHLIAGVALGTGPSNDSPDLPAAVTQAVQYLRIHRLLADAAYDAEPHHQLCRKQLGIRSTVIPVNLRGFPNTIPKTRYRRAMHQRFPKQKAKQRWQGESVISRFKRRLGSALTARAQATRNDECYIRVLTYDLMILKLCA